MEKEHRRGLQEHHQSSYSTCKLNVVYSVVCVLCMYVYVTCNLICLLSRTHVHTHVCTHACTHTHTRIDTHTCTLLHDDVCLLLACRYCQKRLPSDDFYQPVPIFKISKLRNSSFSDSMYEEVMNSNEQYRCTITMPTSCPLLDPIIVSWLWQCYLSVMCSVIVYVILCHTYL